MTNAWSLLYEHMYGPDDEHRYVESKRKEMGDVIKLTSEPDPMDYLSITSEDHISFNLDMTSTNPNRYKYSEDSKN